jgi:uncharacterized protein (UPF0276 family)
MTDFQNPRSSVGIGLRSKYLEYFLVNIPQIDSGWLEVHPENYLHHYPNRKKLQKISERYPISFHCISLSLGSESLPCREHLQSMKKLMDEINPFAVSDHLSWNTLKGHGYNDLYPLELTDTSLQRVVQHINILQDFFQRPLLIENPSTYLSFKGDTYSESEFLNALVKKTGCGLLLDVNNLYVQSVNHGWNTHAYLAELNMDAVKEIHLAGHVKASDGNFLIDTHNQPVCQEVWELYKVAILNQPPAYTLIEWDEDLPEIDVILNQARQAALYMEQACMTI